MSIRSDIPSEIIMSTRRKKELMILQMFKVGKKMSNNLTVTSISISWNIPEKEAETKFMTVVAAQVVDYWTLRDQTKPGLDRNGSLAFYSPSWLSKAETYN